MMFNNKGTNVSPEFCIRGPLESKHPIMECLLKTSRSASLSRHSNRLQRLVRGLIQEKFDNIWGTDDLADIKSNLSAASNLADIHFMRDYFQWSFAQAYAKAGYASEAYDACISTIDLFIILRTSIASGRFDFAKDFAERTTGSGFTQEDVKRAARIAQSECISLGNNERAESIRKVFELSNC